MNARAAFASRPGASAHWTAPTPSPDCSDSSDLPNSSDSSELFELPATEPLHLCVLLLADPGQPSGALRAALEGLGYRICVADANARTLAVCVEAESPDVVIVHTVSPSREMLAQLAAITRAAPRPVLMLSADANQDLIRDAFDAGVTAYLVEGVAAERLAAALEVTLARFAHEAALRERLAKAESELADRKLIDRTKRLLIERRKLSERDAYAMLRKHAMDQGIKLVEAARQLSAEADLRD